MFIKKFVDCSEMSGDIFFQSRGECHRGELCDYFA